MGLSKPGIAPKFVIKANGSDISQKIAKRLISLRYTDCAGLKSDVLEFSLADGVDDAPISLPVTGAELELFLGYDGQATRMGKFVVDEIEREGWPDTITIRANAAVFDESKNGEKQLQTQKNRHWRQATLNDIVQTIAKEHGLEPVVSSSIKTAIVYGTHQVDESDSHFLIRIARRLDAVVKVAGGKLMVVKKAEGQTMSGKSLKFSVTPAEVTSYRLTIAKREEAGAVRVYWHEIKTAKRKHAKVKHKSKGSTSATKPIYSTTGTANNAETVGSGEPEVSLRMQFTDKETAIAAAKAELARRARQKATLALTLPGHPELSAEGQLSVSGFRDGVNGDWNITKVEHDLGASGYSCHIECEIVSGGSYSVDEVTEGADDTEDAVDDAKPSQ